MKISRKPESHVRALSDGCSSPQKTYIRLPNRNSKIPDFGLTLASIDEFLLQEEPQPLDDGLAPEARVVI